MNRRDMLGLSLAAMGGVFAPRFGRWYREASGLVVPDPVAVWSDGLAVGDTWVAEIHTPGISSFNEVWRRVRGRIVVSDEWLLSPLLTVTSIRNGVITLSAP